MTNAAPTPMTARAPITAPEELDDHGEQRRGAEHDEPAVEREPAAVAVTERAGGEQQAGEHEASRRRRSTAAPLAPVWRLSARVGSATLRLALAITIITRLMHSTPSVHHRRS